MRRWTQEERERQAQLIQKWQPWKQSTGAKTAEGKRNSSQNALKHGGRSQGSVDLMRQLRGMLKATAEELEQVKP